MKTRTNTMMRLQITALFLFAALWTVPLSAQTFSFAPLDTSASGESGKEIAAHADFRNLTNRQLSVTITRTRNELPSGWSSAFCLLNCYAPFTDEAVEIVEPNAVIKFAMYFYTMKDSHGTGTVEIRISATDNPEENYTVTFHATTSPSTAVSPAATGRELFLGRSAPNPVSALGTISVSGLRVNAPVRLVLYDALGKPVKVLWNGSAPAGTLLVSFDTRGLRSGMYFYRLETPLGVRTRKMMVVQ